MKKLLTFVLILASVQGYGQIKEPGKLTSMYDYGDTSKQRYFIISYSYFNGFGQMSWYTKNNEYINREAFNKYCHDEIGNDNAVILNIIELNKKDIETFNRETDTK